MKTEEIFPKQRLGVPLVAGPCLERLAKQRKCFRNQGWLAVSLGEGGPQAPTPVQGGDTLRIPRATGGVGPQCLFYSCDCFVLLL